MALQSHWGTSLFLLHWEKKGWTTYTLNIFLKISCIKHLRDRQYLTKGEEKEAGNVISKSSRNMPRAMCHSLGQSWTLINRAKFFLEPFPPLLFWKLSDLWPICMTMHCMSNFILSRMTVTSALCMGSWWARGHRERLQARRWQLQSKSGLHGWRMPGKQSAITCYCTGLGVKVSDDPCLGTVPLHFGWLWHKLTTSVKQITQKPLYLRQLMSPGFNNAHSSP